jgi:hypothetical protein
VIVDGGSEMKGVLIAMCEQLGIPCHQAPPEAHESVLCERFHRCLNEAQKIGAADTESHEKWAMKALFAARAWNGSPVDGTDIIRSFAAKARTFHFPLDVVRPKQEPSTSLWMCSDRRRDSTGDGELGCREPCTWFLARHRETHLCLTLTFTSWQITAPGHFARHCHLL